MSEFDGPSEWGALMPWRDQILSTNIDALIICAPPEVTTEVALACAKAGKRCVATKPLTVTQPPDNFSGHRQCVYVDLWRIYSPAWQALKAEIKGKKIERVSVEFYGNGPQRSFSGLLDYAPHALAFVGDLLGHMPQLTFREGPPGQWRGEADIPMAGSVSNRVTTVRVETGNGFSESQMSVRVKLDSGLRYQWRESTDDGAHLFLVGGQNHPTLECDRSLALRSFCRAFLAGEPSDTLWLSCDAMKVLMPMVG